MGQKYLLTYVPDANVLLFSALGLTCYHCEANQTNGELCTNKTHYTMVNCTGAEAECAVTQLMTVGFPASAYVLNCVNVRTNISHVNCNG